MLMRIFMGIMAAFSAICLLVAIAMVIGGS
jgi:hypothetical protein